MATIDERISYRVNGGAIKAIPGGQAANLLRFLWCNRDRQHQWGDLYEALRSQEVHRCLHTLRRKWGIPIVCVQVPKARGIGKIGLYSLGPNVEVIDGGNCHVG